MPSTPGMTNQKWRKSCCLFQFLVCAPRGESEINRYSASPQICPIATKKGSTFDPPTIKQPCHGTLHHMRKYFPPLPKIDISGGRQTSSHTLRMFWMKLIWLKTKMYENQGKLDFGPTKLWKEVQQLSYYTVSIVSQCEMCLRAIHKLGLTVYCTYCILIKKKEKKKSINF